MKQKILLLISFLAFNVLLYSQNIVECYPLADDYHTGSTNGLEFTQTSLIKTEAGLIEAGWARFDLSSIPEGAYIEAVELNIYVSGDNNAYWQVMSIENDPINGTAADVFADCTDGDIYASWTGSDFPEPDWFIADLGESAVTALNNQMGDGWFAISMWEFEGGGLYAIECHGWDEDNPPYINVSYLEPGSPFPPYDPIPTQASFSIDIETDLQWTFGENTETYDVYFGTDNPPATMVVNNEAAGATGTYDPGTLEYNTTYYWQVVAKNSTNLETPGPVWEFTTTCDAFAVPFSEDFNALIPPELPYCWSAYANSTTGFAYVETIQWNGLNNTYCLAMENADNPDATLLFISPKIEGGAAGKYINFYAWGYAPAVSIGTITDPSNPDTYTELEQVTVSNVYLDYQEYEVFFTNYTGDDDYIAIKLITNDFYQGSYFEDILIDVAPTCPKPSVLYTQETTTTTATIGWQENGDATMWNIEYGPLGFTPTGVANAFADSNPFVLTGLESSTSYDFYVQADCGGGDVSYWNGPSFFQTQCETQAVPYFEDFEDAPMPLTPPCIAVENVNGDDDFWYTSDITPFNGTQHIRIDYNWEMDMDDWFYSAPLELVGGETYIVQFYYTSNSESYVEQLEVLWGTQNNSTAMVNGPIFEDLSISYGNTYYEGIGYFTPPSDGEYFVGWHGFSIANQFYIYVDDITIDVAPSCLKPTGLFVTNPTSSSAFINWTENGSATQWNLEYVLSGEAPTGTPNATADSNPFELTDLLSGTTYDCYVQADCGGGDVSWWSQPVTFTTLCDDFAVPFTEDFSNVTPPEIPDCWLEYETTSGAYMGVYTYEWTYLSPPYGLVLENGNDALADVIFISPPIEDDDGAAGKYINFFAYGYAPELSVGTMTDPYDVSTYNEITTVPLTYEWTEYEVFFNNYTGDDNFIALKGAYTGPWQSIYIDDIVIDHPPTCPKPSNLYTSDSQTNSIVLHWTENGDATMWNIEYGEAGFTPTGIANALADSNPFELTDLTDGTAYEFYVQADCGGGDLSYWVGPVMFQTQCFPAELPYFEDFEVGVFPPSLPVCAAFDDANNDGTTWQTSSNLPYSGIFHLMVGYTFAMDMNDWYFSAPLELLGGQTYNLSFYYTTNTSTYLENLEVKFGMEPTAEGMTSEPVFVDEMFYYNNEYQLAEVQFSPDEDGVYYLGWHCYSISGQWDTYIDDIYVEWDNSLIVTATATPDEICEGDESQLNGSAVGGSGNYTYSWTSDPAGFTSTEADPMVAPEVTTDYFLEINDGMISMYDTVTVIVHEYPGQPGTPNGIAYLCAGITNTTYSTSGSTGADSYDWILDPAEAGTVSGSGSTISVSWVENYTGTITLKVAGVNNGCVGVYSNPLTIIRYLPDVTLEPFDMVELDWPAFELTGGLPEGGEYTGSGCVDGWFHPDVAGLGDHIITYSYTDVNLCENSADQMITVVLEIGIHELQGFDVRISPNPNNGLFKLNVNSTLSRKANIFVINGQGMEMIRMNDVNLNENYSADIDLSSFAKGLYYVRITADDVNYIEKVLIK